MSLGVGTALWQEIICALASAGLDIGFVPLGDRQLKNMATSVAVFGLVINEQERVAATSDMLRPPEPAPPRGRSPLSAYKRAMRRYFEAKGRSDRYEFWSFVLVAVILTMVAGTLDALLFRAPEALGDAEPFAGIATLVHLIPGVTAAIRRMHDLDRTGRWVFLLLVPVLGWLWLASLCERRGTPGPNRYGPPDPA